MKARETSLEGSKPLFISSHLIQSVEMTIITMKDMAPVATQNKTIRL